MNEILPNINTDFLNEQDVQRFQPILQDFLTAYAAKPESQKFDEWLENQLQKNLADKAPSEIVSLTAQIINGVDTFSNNLQTLNSAIENGVSKETWFARVIQNYAKENNVDIQSLGNHLTQIHQLLIDNNTAIMQALSVNGGGIIKINPSAVLEYDSSTDNLWNTFNTAKLAIDVAKQSSLTGIADMSLATGFNLALKSVSGGIISDPMIIDEIIDDALSSGNDDEIKKTAAAALKVAIDRKIFNNLPDSMSAYAVANISALGIENAKIFYSLGSGIISPLQAVDLTARNYVALIAGTSFEKIGTGIGATMFSFIPVVGTTVGGMIGGMVGRMAGNKVAKVMQSGIGKVASVAVTVARKTWQAISSTTTNVAKGIKSAVRAVAGFFGF